WAVNIYHQPGLHAEAGGPGYRHGAFHRGQIRRRIYRTPFSGRARYYAAILGRQPLGCPGFFFPGVANAVVKPVGPSLPEFDNERLDPKSTPLAGAGDDRIRSELLLQLGKSFLKDTAVGDGVALGGGPGADLRTAGAAVEVFVGPLRGQAMGYACHANLSFNFGPENR